MGWCDAPAPGSFTAIQDDIGRVVTGLAGDGGAVVMGWCDAPPPRSFTAVQDDIGRLVAVGPLIEPL